MAVSSIDFPVAAPEAGVQTRLDELRARWRRWRMYRQTIAELSELSEPEMHDMGMIRCAIRSVAWHAVYGSGRV